MIKYIALMHALGFLVVSILADKCENTAKYDGRCPLFKKSNFCGVKNANKYLGFMTDHCKRTCGFCSESYDCTDSKAYVDKCPEWSSGGYCKISPTNPYYNFMVDHCRKTCKFCTLIQDNCTDSEKYAGNCANWKSFCTPSETNQYYGFMMDHCKKTCGTCDSIHVRYKSTCGKRPSDRGRVIGGNNASANSWPWQVALIYNNEFVCGGTLLSSQWVLTAAHCVFGLAPQLFRITLGEHDREKFEGPEQNLGVSSIFVHPKYDLNTFDSDIAMMKLSRSAILSKLVNPACLPQPDSVVPPSRLCYITGWGKIVHPGPFYRFLQEAELPYVKLDVCQRANNPFGVSTNVTTNMICAGDGTLKSGCHGDSGGPFVCVENDRWTLEGAVSWGSAACNAQLKHTVFTRISKFVHWIEQIAATN